MNLPTLNRREFTIGLAALTHIPHRRSFDVVVIGAGVFGAWIALECRIKGWTVLLLDSRGPGNSSSSSGGESRILRVGYGAQRTYSQWAKHSLDKWQDALQKNQSTKLFLRTGVLWLGPEKDPYLLATRNVLQDLEVPFEILGSDKMAVRYPQIRLDHGDVGIFESESGTILARRAVDSIVEMAIRHGITYRTRLIVPPNVDGRLESIRTAEGEVIFADKFVFACGPWLPTLFPEALGKLIHATRQEVYFFATPPGSRSFEPDSLPSWVDFRVQSIFYGCPSVEHRGFKIASDRHGPIMNPDLDDRVPQSETIVAIKAFLRSRFPNISNSPCVETRVCQYENTDSGDFLIDLHPNSSNTWIVGGGSGHGFKHGPAVGEYVVSVLSGGHSDERFSLSRATAQKVRSIH